MRTRRVVTSIASAALAVLLAGVCSGSGPSAPPFVAPPGIHKIQHVIVIMQENRSFDNYFGTYPGRRRDPDGARRAHGVHPRPRRAALRPAVRRPHRRRTAAGRTRNANALADVDHGKMDGFVASSARRAARRARESATRRACDVPAAAIARRHGLPHGSDLPNYWTYARDFVLQDHMFEPDASWSLPAHLFLVSEWAAACTAHDDPNSCRHRVPATPSHVQPPRFRQSAAPGSEGADLRVDRPHVPAAQGARVVALLRRSRQATRLRERRGHLRAGRAERA